MKTIITTVGTSLFTNYSEHRRDAGKSNPIADSLETLENELASSYDDFATTDIAKIRRVLTEVEKDWLKQPAASAEIQSIEKFIRESNLQEQQIPEQIRVYLLATDTVLSRLAAEIIDEELNRKYPTIAVFEPEYGKGIIEGLVVAQPEGSNDPNFFDKGLMKLVERAKQLIDQAKAEKGEAILNISGGYKGVIPVMTIIGQLEGVPLIYQYERSDSLVKIGGLPVNVDWDVIEEYVVYLRIETKLLEASEEIVNKMRSLYLIEGKYGEHKLSFIGKLLSEYVIKYLPPFYETVMGYFVEYKVEECYAKKHGKLNVTHSYNKLTNGADIDVLIHTESEFIPIEVKPLSIIWNDWEFNDKIKDKYFSRVLELSQKEGRQPTEVWLILYSYMYLGEKPTDNLLSSQDINFLKDASRYIQCKNLKFKVKHFWIEANKVAGGNRMMHQGFMKTSLKESKIKDIFEVTIS